MIATNERRNRFSQGATPMVPTRGPYTAPPDPTGTNVSSSRPGPYTAPPGSTGTPVAPARGPYTAPPDPGGTPTGQARPGLFTTQGSAKPVALESANRPTLNANAGLLGSGKPIGGKPVSVGELVKKGTDPFQSARNIPPGAIPNPLVAPEPGTTPGENGQFSIQDQMQGLLEDPSNPLMQQAKTQALQGMNSRGLQNSSLSITAGMDAMTKRAFDIASQQVGINFQQYAFDKQKEFDRLALEKNLSLDERQMMTSAFSGMFNNMIASFSKIMTDTGLSANGKRTSVEELIQYFTDQISSLADLNNYDVDWEM